MNSNSNKGGKKVCLQVGLHCKKKQKSNK